MITRYIFTETIDYIVERFNDNDKSLGWWIKLEGSQEVFYISTDQPALKNGDRVKITLEKVT